MSLQQCIHKKMSGSDSSLVSNENFSEIGPKTASLMTSLTKIPQPPTKNFFRVQTRRFAKSFEGLNSSVAQSLVFG